jgi:hypothetical protein
MKITGPGLVLRLEDLAVLAGSVLLYAKLDASWVLFAALFLVPDVFMIGYALNRQTGAALYNFAHTYVAPLLLAALGFLQEPTLYAIALIWSAHIGFDRVIGYGLKYTEGFKSTHLGRV